MTIMTKSAYEFWHKKKLPYDVAYLYHNKSFAIFGKSKWKWEVKTYTQLIAEKSKRQLERLNWKRNYDLKIVKPCLIQARKNDRNRYYLYVKGVGIGVSYLSVKVYKKQIESLMSVFNLGVFPNIEFVDIWLNLFYENYPKSSVKNEFGYFTASAICYCIIERREIVDFIKK